ncbi:MAG: hypothetical protein KGV56_04295, partial [Gammaproteobacteria bacterium]|nr:hypothetical protein [Gammaproteobacteria bacterium]
FKVCEHFNWKNRLSSWEVQHSPWNLVQELSERYEDYEHNYQITEFDYFKSYVKDSYPHIDSLWAKMIKIDGYSQVLKKFLNTPLVNLLLYIWLPVRLLLRLFNPFSATQVMKEFQCLENDIGSLKSQSSQIRVKQFLENGNLNVVREWLLGGYCYNLLSKRYYAICFPLVMILICSIWGDVVFNLSDYEVILSVLFVLCLLGLEQKRYSIVFSWIIIGAGVWYFKTFEPFTTSTPIDVLGVIVVTTVFLTIRRFIVNSCFKDSVLEGNYYAYSWKTPQLYVMLICVALSFFLSETWFGIQASIQEEMTVVGVVPILSKDSIDYATTDMLYLVSHLFAFIACAIFFFFLRVRGLSYLYIYGLFAGFLIFIIDPTMKLIVGVRTEINFFHPVISWFVIFFPFILLEIGVALPKLKFLVPIAGAIIGVFNILFLLILCLCNALVLWGEEFSALYLPFTGLALFVWTAIMSVLTYKMFNANSEE